MIFRKRILFSLAAAFLCCVNLSYGAGIPDLDKKIEAKDIDAPVVVNGDTVEYLTDQKQVVATGNVFIVFKGTRLSCDKVTVNTVTKEAVAEGNVLIKDDKEGIMSGRKAVYNFINKTGTVIEGDFMAPPYFGEAREIEKVSDSEFKAVRGNASTCNFDVPHYRVSAKRVTIFPQDKIETEKDVVYIGKCPIAYLPFYNHSLKEPFMHVQLNPGHRKDWGYYLLSAWRYYVNDDFSGRIYLDERSKLGFGGGFGTNYNTDDYGKGDFKYYYTQERPRQFLQDQPAEFERSLVRWRHKWYIDERTDFIGEYYKIDDAKRATLGSEYNLLKDYFYREYEKDEQPRSYAQAHHNFNYSSMDMLVQSRVNDWYDPGFVERLPEVDYSLPQYQFGDSNFYFDSSSSAANLNRKNSNSASPDTADTHVNRLDTTNKLSMPMKLSIFNISPFAGSRETFYDKDLQGDSKLRTIFLTGSDISTKFFRVFDVKTNKYGMDINGLRHIITPTVGYAYDYKPTVPASHLRQIDSVDNITYSSNRATLGLTNTLQTKRNNATVDLGLFSITNTYYFKPKSGPGSYLGDYVFDMELRPYSWVSFYGDAIYSHRYDYFTNANYDVSFSVASERSFGFGQRYQRGGSNELTVGGDWRLTPKWKFGFYERYQVNDMDSLGKGLRYQEYRFSRDLHCWIFDFSYIQEKDKGNSIWLIFRLKAFPETAFKFDKSYNQPKAGSQNY
jgi:LPS-assembly protein